MSIVFKKSGMSDLTLERGRVVPYQTQEQKINQERYLTESYNTKVVNYGSNAQYLELSFKHLTKDNYDGTVNGLKTWFDDSSINWSMNSFTMLDENGISYTVRLWQNNFKMAVDGAGRYSVKLILKVE